MLWRFFPKKPIRLFCVVNKDDILFVLDDDGCILECLYVQCCFSLQSSLFLFVEPMSFLKQEHEADHWRRTHRIELRGVPELRYHLHPLLWAWHDDERLLTLWWKNALVSRLVLLFQCCGFQRWSCNFACCFVSAKFLFEHLNCNEGKFLHYLFALRVFLFCMFFLRGPVKFVLFSFCFCFHVFVFCFACAFDVAFQNSWTVTNSYEQFQKAQQQHFKTS